MKTQGWMLFKTENKTLISFKECRNYKIPKWCWFKM